MIHQDTTHKLVIFKNLTQVLTGTFYAVPCTGLSLRVCLVPDIAVRFLVFLYRYVCIVISGCIQIDQFRVSVIFIFGSGPTKVLSRIILFASEINSHFVIRRIPRADALDKTESSRASFVANVSHELKTPMTSIAGFIDGILDGTIPKEKQNYYLGLVSTEVRRLSRLVVAMLNMSKIESGEFQMKPNNYDISDQIIRILLTFEQKIEKKNIEIIGLEDLQPQYIVADPDMIYQVIYNLFDNAVKFTNEDGFIKVTLEDLGSQIRVSIKNSGAGIKAEELSRVFERFYKVDKSRSLDAKGAGLGLYIVKMMVEMHSGRIYAKSEDENTAEFVFTLPKAFTPVNKKGAKEA